MLEGPGRASLTEFPRETYPERMSSDVSAQLQQFYDAEMRDRASRPLGDERTDRVTAFLAHCRERGIRSVLEVGCGAGRDGTLIADGGFEYVGVDASREAVTVCRELGLVAAQGSATALPFEADRFDAAWSMSTLMHLPGNALARALAELRRVVRPGGLVEIGVWGHTSNREWVKPDGRFFKHRSDDELRGELANLGEVVDFATWDWFDDGGHYQWARVEVATTTA
ncbi:Methyltransferase domain-containing protein [Pedococcus cremeus]|uniref:Methyltransferase domain-containing protein n=2 Tax=Pedococcus cremeus TaxID=587636 RepID=A0A1H9VNB2_9MICO|nr:Methyltransferase domain-containing protein [Pedococcus cremeus]